jgi:DNA repair exonuclease SbcCD ATPase subunit
MSFGNVTEEIELTKEQVTLILGENRDKGINTGERNGVGKSSIAMALHYAITGKSIGNKIKLSNLINKTNRKNMEVTLEFTKNNVQYKIERGRHPEYLRFYIQDNLVVEDAAQGEKKDTQLEIYRHLGMSAELLNQTVLLTTYVEQFLDQGGTEQKNLIEELLGISLLTQKADKLKELIKVTKQAIEQEEFKIKTINDSNNRLLEVYEDEQNRLSAKLKEWDITHTNTIQNLLLDIETLSTIDIEKELQNHETMATWNILNDMVIRATKDKYSLDNNRKSILRDINTISARIAEIEKNIQCVNEDICPTCKQTISNKELMIQTFTKSLNDEVTKLESKKKDIVDVDNRISECMDNIVVMPPKPTLSYNNIKDVYSHKDRLQEKVNKLTHIQNEVNPYIEQLQNKQKVPLQDISREVYDDLNNILTHQVFLFQMLSSKSSYARKQILERNLQHLNIKLKKYLEKLGLPHKVKILGDLSVEINHLGEEYDYANLSRGQRTRLTLALMFSFRDVWESSNDSINLMFMDEIIDLG